MSAPIRRNLDGSVDGRSLRVHPRRREVVGQRFGWLTVIADCKPEKGKDREIICRCKCGNERVMSFRSVVSSGATTSCGCKKDFYWIIASKTGINRESYQRIYRIYSLMNYRCHHKKAPAYKDYGGRGISVCREWRDDFLAFFNWAIQNGYGDGLEIDREKNNGNYTPTNCRWVTKKVNGRNTRQNRYMTYNGQRLAASEWAEKLGVPKDLIYGRLKNGWTDEDTICIPSQRLKNKKTKK